jgi:predicted transposase YbfD/YdcC
MYEYLNQHPLVIRSKVQETHYFDWVFDHGMSENNIQGHRKQYAQNYFETFKLRQNPSLCTGESSPTYMFYR